MTKGRVEAFSDGVFAVAITILVFNVQAPKGASGQLWDGLLRQWPTYAAYIASFLTIGVMWINHHGVFDRVARVDRPLMMLNLLLLMTIVLVPFPTSLMGQFLPGGGADARAAATAYAALAVMIAITFSAVWGYVLSHPQLLVEGMDLAAARRMAPRFAIGFVVYLACIPLAQVSPVGVVFLAGAAAVYYAIERLPEVPGAD